MRARALKIAALVVFLSKTARLAAIDFYVSPRGTASGTGAIGSPWNLVVALDPVHYAPARVVKPGDTIWLRGGTYTGLFTSYLTGTASQPIVVRQYPGERATIDGNTDSSVNGVSLPAMTVSSGGYAWFWGFEVTNSNPSRWNPVSGYPPDVRNAGFYVTAPGAKIINCVIHDTAQGIASYQTNVNGEIYGNLVYYNGWNAPDRGHGHGIYLNNFTDSSKLIKQNILFDPLFSGTYNLHAYGSSASMFVNSRVDGNVWWRGTVLVGGENGFDIGGTSVTGNFSWASSLTTGYGTTKCADVAVGGNYLANLGGTVFSPGSTACRAGETITTNTFVGGLSGFAQGDYPNNTYYARTSPPTQDKVMILLNTYEPGRATIVVYNWDGSATQAVDLTGVVSPGAAYEIRNAQNFYGPPVMSGTYSGGSVTLPMTGLTAATPVGYAAPLPTGPSFNVFVIIPSRLTPPPPVVHKHVGHETQ